MGNKNQNREEDVIMPNSGKIIGCCYVAVDRQGGGGKSVKLIVQDRLERKLGVFVRQVHTHTEVEECDFKPSSQEAATYHLKITPPKRQNRYEPPYYQVIIYENHLDTTQLPSWKAMPHDLGGLSVEVDTGSSANHSFPLKLVDHEWLKQHLEDLIAYYKITEKIRNNFDVLQLYSGWPDPDPVDP